MRYRPEPDGRGPLPGSRTAVLLCNLGTPEAPTAPALRRYLGQFLSDPRVVELPALLWQPILRGIILNVRPAKSAAKYATVWTPEGSPLLAWTRRQATALQAWFSQQGLDVSVRPAMRYGEPSIPAALDALHAEGYERILMLPAYPQYCGATSASCFDALADWAVRRRVLPSWRFVAEYHADDGYIAALADSVRRHWAAHGRAPMLVMSYHGMPERTRRKGDPYHDQCQATSRLLAQALGLSEDQYRVTFQSRFGKEKWLEPATEPTLEALARAGQTRVDVMCPGFSADCLETLEEIAQEGREAFLKAGGQQFHYIACLNEDPAHIAALGAVARRELAGWI